MCRLPVACLIVPLALGLTGCAVNPLTGEDELMFFQQDYDVKVGKAVAPELEEALEGRIEDETLQRYIDAVGQRMARVCHHPEWDYHYVAVQSDEVNAMALPGGYIFITRGLLERLDTEAQLAAILGHETAHVVGRDSMNALSKQTGMQVAAIAAGVADPSAGAGAFYAGQFLMLSYSREDETQADLSGLDYMVEAGYTPEGIVAVMAVLESLMQRHPVEFFLTHPLPENRLHHLRQRIAQRYATASGSGRVGRDDYQRIVRDYLKEHPAPRTKKRLRYRVSQNLDAAVGHGPWCLSAGPAHPGVTVRPDPGSEPVTPDSPSDRTGRPLR